MAEFSVEYCKQSDIGFDGDFSIIEEFNKLKTNHVKPIICEGYGCIAIVNHDDVLKLMFPVGFDGDFALLDYETFVNDFNK